MLFLVIAFVLALLYLAIQLQYIYYWKKIKPASIPPGYIPTSPVSILIVARNESASIQSCLQGILAQNYPDRLVEIIVIDDHSTDDTANKVLAVPDDRIQLLRLGNYTEYIHLPAYKKSAITLGIAKSNHEIIILTDADCHHTPDWLKTMVYAIEKENAVFQTSPVLLIPGKSLLEKMQEAEMLAFMLITGSGIQSRIHDMANGANMAFRKSAFQTIHGYEGNFNYSSGDDMFLIEKMRSIFPNKIHFTKSKEAIAWTYGKTKWSDLIRQRLRWASKNQGLQNKSITIIWSFVGLYHIALLVFVILPFFHITSWRPFLIMLSTKWVADYFVLQQSASFFNRFSVLRNFIPSQILYSWYIFIMAINMVVGKKGDWVR